MTREERVDHVADKKKFIFYRDDTELGHLDYMYVSSSTAPCKALIDC